MGSGLICNVAVPGLKASYFLFLYIFYIYIYWAELEIQCVCVFVCVGATIWSDTTGQWPLFHFSLFFWTKLVFCGRKSWRKWQKCPRIRGEITYSTLKGTRQRGAVMANGKYRGRNITITMPYLYLRWFIFYFKRGSYVGHIFQWWIIENVKIRVVKYELVWGGKNEKRLAWD